MESISYERNWCDYFTKCPYRFEEEIGEPYVGDYACARCRFHKGATEDKSKYLKPCDYSKYFENIKGIVKCNYKDSDFYQMQVLMKEQKETAGE